MPDLHDFHDLHVRVGSLEVSVHTVQQELIVIRGNVPLEHKKPVDDGALGDVVQAQDRAKRILWKIVGGLVAFMLTSAGGAYVALRGSLLEQGREEERRLTKDQYLLDLERRLRLVESHYVAQGVTPVVGQRP